MSGSGLPRPDPARLAGGLMLVLALAILVIVPAFAIFGASWRPDAASLPGRGLLDQAIGPDRARPLGLILTSIQVAAVAVLVAVPAGAIAALLIERTDLPGRGLLRLLMILALFLPLPLHAAAWLTALGPIGRTPWLWDRPILVGVVGAGVVHGLAALPWAYLIAAAGLRAVEPELEDHARLDFPAPLVILRVTLHRAAGALAASALAVAVLTAGDMTVTDLLQVRTFAEECYLQSQLGDGVAGAARAAVLPVLILLPLVAVMGRALARIDPTRVREARSTPRPFALGIWRGPLGIMAAILALIALGLPLASLVARAGLAGGRAALGLAPSWSVSGLIGTLTRAWPDVVEPSALSYDVLSSPLAASSSLALAAATLAAGVAWGLAWFARGSTAWSAATLAVAALLLAAPGPVVGLAFKVAYLPYPWIHDTAAIVVLTLAARMLPFALAILVPAVRAAPSSLLDAGVVAGLGPRDRLVQVAWPLTARAALAAVGVSFALGFGELPASNVVLPPGVTTAPLRVWMLLHTGVEGHTAGVVLILVLISAGVGLLAARLAAGSLPDEDPDR